MEELQADLEAAVGLIRELRTPLQIEGEMVEKKKTRSSWQSKDSDESKPTVGRHAMAKLGLVSVIASISGLLTSTQFASAESLQEQFGLTASSLVAVGWLGLLVLLAVAIILPLIRRSTACPAICDGGLSGLSSRRPAGVEAAE